MASRANIYELLDDEGSGPAPAKKAVAAAPAAKSAAAAPAKKAAAAAAATQAPAAAAPAQGQRQAGEKKFGADKAPRARGNPAEARDRERVERKRTDKEGGHGAGTAGEGRTKRVFDRQSGTGRPRTEQKKGGAGKGNWGKQEDLAKAVEGEASASAAVANVEASVVAAVAKEGEAAAPAENAPAAEEKKVEEPVGLTLKEWKAKQAKKAVEAANVRKANEGADKKDAKKWEEFKAIDKNNAADLTADSILAALPIQTENKAATDAAKPAAKSSDNASTGAKKTVRVAANDLLQLKAPAHVYDDSEESDRRGGRGGRGPRPGGDRRGPRNDRPQGAAAGGQSPRGKHVSSPVFDDSSFPSLSVKA